MVRQHYQLNGYEYEQTPGDRRQEEPGVLQSMGSQRVRHHLVTEKQQKIDIYIQLSLCCTSKNIVNQLNFNKN